MFEGRDGFEWFTGVVEDRNDPKALNRVRVRIFGIHTHDKQKIATADLPWATVMMPTTSSSVSGLGTTLHGLVEGSWVIGFFRDGVASQQPVILGSFIGQPSNISRGSEDGDVLRNPTSGFNDPRFNSTTSYEGTPEGIAPDHLEDRKYGLTLGLDDSPRRDGEKRGVSYPKTEYTESEESSVNKLARQDGKYDKDIYPNNFIEEGGVGKTLFDGTIIDGGRNEDRGEWVKPKYPFNHVYESESGHVVEIDDTPGYERINLFHRKGARIEINNEGEIHMVAAAGQDINLQGKNVNINDYGIGTLNIRSAGKILMNALGDGVKIATKGKTDIVASGETKITSLKDVIMKAVKKVKIQ